jgi:hypothetical protein
MISKLQGACLRAPDAITLQLFYAPGMAFTGDTCLTASAPVQPNGKFDHTFQLPNSAPYLRLDIAEYFLRASDFHATINDQDILSRIVVQNQMKWLGDVLVCGFDAHCIIDNPFAGKDITVTISGTMQSGI